MKEFKYVITDKEGIHARPAGELIKVVKGFNSTIKIATTNNGHDFPFLFIETSKKLARTGGRDRFYCLSASSFSTTARRTQTQSSAEAVSTSSRLG